jgi:hypothetical protein
VGDSPELCRVLDSHGFADLDASLALNCSLESLRPFGHPLRESWSIGQVGTLFATMDEVWQHCALTGARMSEGVLKIEEVLRVIIEAEGSVVPEEFYRTGRRCRRVDAKGDCEHKPAKKAAQGKPLWPNHATSPLRQRTSSFRTPCARASSSLSPSLF